MTDAERTRMYFDHLTRDYDLATNRERCMQSFARRARSRGHLFILGDAS